MARYTQEDIDAAVQEGLITQEDGAYLAEALQPGAPVGGIAGGVAGGLLGARVGGGIGGPIGAGVGALAGGGLGALAGSAIAPRAQGEGVEGEAIVGRNMTTLDHDMALRMLIDPNTPAETKRRVLNAMQVGIGEDFYKM